MELFENLIHSCGFSLKIINMRIILKEKIIVLVPEVLDDEKQIQDWISKNENCTFQVHLQSGSNTLELHKLSQENIINKEPLNIIFYSSDKSVQMISNLGNTPFELDGKKFESVEGFWQGLKFEKEWKRREVAKLHGLEAKKIGKEANKQDTFIYKNNIVETGSPDHWQLMKVACVAKFSQNKMARNALLHAALGEMITVVHLHLEKVR